MTAPTNEIRYQFIKLVRSGRTLREAKAMAKAVSGALHKDYTSAKDLKDLAKLEGLNHLLMTRPQAIDLMTLKLKATRNYTGTRADAIAQWASGYRKHINWRRDGNLVRKGKPNKPKPGSSDGKIGRTVVSGADKTLRDFDGLVKSLRSLQKKHGRGNTDRLRKEFKKVRTSVKANITG
tara:strand:+ start:7928 stop:8464 length:537 start_codon:yes stop_codon:yes gene_type:complete